VSTLARWAAGEPVRLYVYSVVAAILAVFVVYGFVNAQYLPVILAAVSAIVAVPTVEITRSKVTPYNPTPPAVVTLTPEV
jgi:hypothetical protein